MLNIFFYTFISLKLLTWTMQTKKIFATEIASGSLKMTIKKTHTTRMNCNWHCLQPDNFIIFSFKVLKETKTHLPTFQFVTNESEVKIMCLLTLACVCVFWLFVLSRLFTVLRPFNNLANVVLFFVSLPSVKAMVWDGREKRAPERNKNNKQTNEMKCNQKKKKRKN